MYRFHPLDTQFAALQTTLSIIVAADALGPCIAMPFADMIWILWDIQFSIFHDDRFDLLMPISVPGW